MKHEPNNGRSSRLVAMLVALGLLALWARNLPVVLRLAQGSTARATALPHSTSAIPPTKEPSP